MSDKTWTFVNKAGWGAGPWDQEPDKVEWPDDKTGLACMVRRSPIGGNWCGYVGVEPQHPFYGVPYGACALPPAQRCRLREYDMDSTDEIERRMAEMIARRPQIALMTHCQHTPEHFLDCHGGITYSDFCDPEEGVVQLANGTIMRPEFRICHAADEATGVALWWFGFDCGHYCDQQPGLECLTDKAHLTAEAQRLVDPELDEMMAGIEENLLQYTGKSAREAMRWPGTEYRDLAYVRHEVDELARQLGEFAELERLVNEANG